jgi:hypothetical protein
MDFSGGTLAGVSYPGTSGGGTCALFYSAPTGDGLSGVGDAEARNSYRGMYWTGESVVTCGGSVRLAIVGDISGITYQVAVWAVDVTDNLQLGTKLCSINIAGSSLVNGWNDFEFPTPVSMPTGKTVVLISRVDPETHDGSNCIRVYNGYDESDVESRQWNIHYEADGTMAGRSAGDEDQPEYFTCDWKLNSYQYYPAASLEYPNIPEDISTTVLGSTSIRLDWFERGVNGVVVDHYNIYSYNLSTGAMTKIGESETTSFTHTDLTPSTTYTYVITAVSVSGTESYHSLKNGTNWSATTTT